MTTEQIKMNGVIAEYDGWVKSEDQPVKGRVLYGKDGCRLLADQFSYLTSMDWLHTLAMKVRGKLRIIGTQNAYKKVQDIDCACCCEPINGQYIDLFTAVYNGIVFLNEQKHQP